MKIPKKLRTLLVSNEPNGRVNGAFQNDREKPMALKKATHPFYEQNRSSQEKDQL